MPLDFLFASACATGVRLAAKFWDFVILIESLSFDVPAAAVRRLLDYGTVIGWVRLLTVGSVVGASSSVAVDLFMATAPLAIPS